jgi:hypothetical protein
VKKWLTLAALAIGLLTGSIRPAEAAATTTLICHNDDRPDFGQISVILNEAKGTVSINYPARSVPNGRFPPIDVPASSTGPMTAKFGSDSIDFSQQKAETDTLTLYSRYNIDRLTGVLLAYQSTNAPWDKAAPRDRVMWHYSCHKGEKQF